MTTSIKQTMEAANAVVVSRITPAQGARIYASMRIINALYGFGGEHE